MQNAMEQVDVKAALITAKSAITPQGLSASPVTMNTTCLILIQSA
jgi:hypothetical protein